MKHRGRGRDTHEIKVDMTPMIDLTFLLVMFFVLTSAFTSLNLEDVLLPVAFSAADHDKEGRVLIINIKKTKAAEKEGTREGMIRFNSETHTTQSLRKALALEVEVDGGRHGYEFSGKQKMSKLQVLIRADEGVRGVYLRQVFMACQREGIYKLKLSSLQP